MINLRDSLSEVTGSVVKRDQLTSEIVCHNQRRISINVAESILFTQLEQLKENAKEFEKLIQKQETDITSYNSLASDQGKAILKNYVEVYGRYMRDEKTRELSMRNRDKEAIVIYTKSRNSIVPEMRKHLEVLNELTEKQLSEKSTHANSETNQSIGNRNRNLSCVNSGALFYCFYSYWRILTKSIAEIVKGLSDGSA